MIVAVNVREFIPRWIGGNTSTRAHAINNTAVYQKSPSAISAQLRQYISTCKHSTKTAWARCGYFYLPERPSTRTKPLVASERKVTSRELNEVEYIISSTSSARSVSKIVYSPQPIFYLLSRWRTWQDLSITFCTDKEITLTLILY